MHMNKDNVKCQFKTKIWNVNVVYKSTSSVLLTTIVRCKTDLSACVVNRVERSEARGLKGL